MVKLKSVLFSAFALLLMCGCGKPKNNGNASNSEPDATKALQLSSENIVGRWRVTSVVIEYKKANFSGESVIEIHSDGSYISVDEAIKLESNGEKACTAIDSGTWKILPNGFETTTLDARGDSKCREKDFNPTFTKAEIVSEKLRVFVNEKSYIEYEKQIGKTPFNFDALAEKFEKATLLAEDKDLLESIEVTTSISGKVFFKSMCPKLSFELSDQRHIVQPIFQIGDKKYGFDSDWDETEVAPAGYNGKAPHFDFFLQKDASTVGGITSYHCKDASYGDKIDCLDKCQLNVSDYNLSEQKGKFEYTCSNLPVSNAESEIKLFGDSVDSLKITAECNYNPKLLD
jgi:hypothetical protein